jgi:hypothetical protein
MPTHGRALTRFVGVNLTTTLAFISGPYVSQTLWRGSIKQERIHLTVMSKEDFTGKQETSHAFCLMMPPIFSSMDKKIASLHFSFIPQGNRKANQENIEVGVRNNKNFKAA